MNGIVAIVGRPNVGKSTLFNRLVEQRRAIVEDQPGVTRDRISGAAHWAGRDFTVIDTGGYVPLSADVFEAAIREQVEIALDQADVAIFVVDVKDGLTHADAEVLDVLRRRQAKNVIVAVNKVDNYQRDLAAGEFYGLGVEELYPISAMSGAGTGELLDRAVALLPAETSVDELGNIPRVAIVGRPNVGKSSLVNALLGRNEHIVTDVAGTTRDSVGTRYQAYGFDMLLVDTAGLRRKARVSDNVEFYSTIRTVRAIQEANVCALLIDATQGIEAQDLTILSIIERHKKGIVILVNKWDLASKEKNADVEMRKVIEERLLPLQGVPILFISAKDKLRLHKTLEVIQRTFEEGKRRVPTHALNDTLLPIIQNTPPPSARGKLVRIKFVSQGEGACPTFLLFANHPKDIKDPYKRFLESKIREHFGFQGWPIQIFAREK